MELSSSVTSGSEPQFPLMWEEDGATRVVRVIETGRTVGVRGSAMEFLFG